MGVGAGPECDWGVKLSYTRFYTETEDTVAGNVTPVFLGNRMATSLLPDTTLFRQMETSRPRSTTTSWTSISARRSVPSSRCNCGRCSAYEGPGSIRTLTPSFDTRGPGIFQRITSDEHIKNNFWGIGPKLGIENSLNLWSGEKCQIDLTLNFYTAYLLGFWAISDVTTNAAILGTSPYDVPINDRHFGALTFQAMIGVNLKYQHWNATAGYEINDWLNQCQIFDDATGPHNNDLIVQGLSIRVSYGF